MERTLDPSKQLVYQATAISRAAYDLSTNAKRLLYAAASCIKLTDTEIPTVTMAVGDVIRALGLNDGRLVYERLEQAVDGLMGKVITIHEANGGWRKYVWVTRARYDAELGTIELKFDEEVRGYLLGLRHSFSVFALRDVGKLQGKYALRIFEIVTANQGFSGVGGNAAGEWFVDLLFADLRVMFALGPGEYKATNNLRRNLVDGPVREINEADLGLRLECDYETHRRGRVLRGVRIKARTVGREDPRVVSPATQAERDEAQLIAANPARYAEILREEEAAQALPGLSIGSPEFRAMARFAAEAAARPKRGRPRKTPPAGG